MVKVKHLLFKITVLAIITNLLILILQSIVINPIDTIPINSDFLFNMTLNKQAI